MFRTHLDALGVPEVEVASEIFCRLYRQALEVAVRPDLAGRLNESRTSKHRHKNDGLRARVESYLRCFSIYREDARETAPRFTLVRASAAIAGTR